MDEISSKSRTALLPLLRIVNGARSRTTSDKELRTFHSRQHNFLKFLLKSHLGNNPALIGYTQEVRNTIMACYTADLVAGENILCMSLKSGTILRYLQAAAELSIPSNMMNPCIDVTGKQSRFIKDILHEVKRWEIMPNRQEPVTKEIIEYAIKKGKNSNGANPHNLYTALGDWLILGHQSGFRRREWAQDRTYLKKHKDVQRNIDGSPAAFVMNDWEFRSKDNKRLNHSSDRQISHANMINVKWRFQKNNDNGQIISYVEDNKNPVFCYVRAAKRIRARAITLQHPHDKPLAIFRDNKKTHNIIYIDDIHIKNVLQEAAKSVYNISKKEDLQRFSSHSIRVGACVLLHSQNISTEDIKFRLRWRSDAFRMYLRNITQLAERHRDAVARA